MRLANQIEELKTEAKLGDGYRFDVKPHRNDPKNGFMCLRVITLHGNG